MMDIVIYFIAIILNDISFVSVNKYHQENQFPFKCYLLAKFIFRIVNPLHSCLI